MHHAYANKGRQRTYDYCDHEQTGLCEEAVAHGHKCLSPDS